MDWVLPAIACGGMAAFLLKRSTDVLHATAQAPSRLDMDLIMEERKAAAAPGVTPAQYQSPGAAKQPPSAAWLERDRWLMTFNGTGRDREYDRCLKQLYHLKRCGSSELVDESSRLLESIVVGAQKLVDGVHRPTKAIHSLLITKFVNLSVKLRALQNTILRPDKARDAAILVEQTEVLAERYFQVIVGHCIDAL